MSPTIKLMLLVFMMTIAEVLALTSLKKFSETKKAYYFIASIFLYVIICALIVISFRFKEMSLLNALWNGLSIVLVIIVGYLLFKERITKYELLGVFLIIIAIYLIASDK